MWKKIIINNIKNVNKKQYTIAGCCYQQNRIQSNYSKLFSNFAKDDNEDVNKIKHNIFELMLTNNNDNCDNNETVIKKEIVNICNENIDQLNASSYHSLIYAINHNNNENFNISENISDLLYFQMLQQNKMNIEKPLNNNNNNNNNNNKWIKKHGGEANERKLSNYIFDLHQHNRYSVLSGIRYVLHTIQIENLQRNLIVILGRGNHSNNKKANIRRVVEEYLRYELLIDYKYVAKGGALHLDRYSVYKNNRINEVFMV